MTHVTYVHVSLQNIAANLAMDSGGPKELPADVKDQLCEIASLAGVQVRRRRRRRRRRLPGPPPLQLWLLITIQIALHVIEPHALSSCVSSCAAGQQDPRDHRRSARPSSSPLSSRFCCRSLPFLAVLLPFTTFPCGFTAFRCISSSPSLRDAPIVSLCWADVEGSLASGLA